MRMEVSDMMGSGLKTNRSVMAWTRKAERIRGPDLYVVHDKTLVNL
jgi:hypothetical protein